MSEFKPFPKIPRLFRNVIVTEKIDGTNACVQILPAQASDSQDGQVAGVVGEDGEFYTVGAQSRNRTIAVGDDNHGFAAWVYDNSLQLVNTLGPGYHYGEWWGQGIQRRYGLDHKRFSLFNTYRWGDVDLSPVPGLHMVPVLARHTFDTDVVEGAMNLLRQEGSVAAPGFPSPEGVVVFHGASGHIFKALLENDETPKGMAA
jgi:hypothetical protein